MLIPLDAMDAEPLHIARCHNLSDLSYNTCMLFMVSPSVVNSVQFWMAICLAVIYAK
jgi:hypothetical protein